MIELSLAVVAKATRGALHDADPTTRVTHGVEYDSRRIEPGGLFLALPGEHVDGHEFAGSAIDRGAVAVLCTRPVHVPRIQVADGVEAVTESRGRQHVRSASGCLRDRMDGSTCSASTAATC